MKPDAIRFDLLFDADEYYRSGICPWTFFAYPTSLSNAHGLPPDAKACELLSLIQQHGIDVAIWVSGIAENTTYYACRQDDMQRLTDVLNVLASSGRIEMDFCAARSERLFARLTESTEQRVADEALDEQF